MTARAVHELVTGRFPGVALVGGTSCGGVMSGAGLAGPGSIGLFLVEDPDGDYGAAATGLGGDPAAAAERALVAALEAAGCPGELPELVWIYQSPGCEEAVLEGLRRLIGDRCPVIGGSAADDGDGSGRWGLVGPDGARGEGLVVGVLFSSRGIGCAFQGGYEPTGESGIVTRIGFDRGGESGIVTRTRGRHIVAIDGRPAAEVYDAWIGGGLAHRLDQGGSVLGLTTLNPLGIDAGSVDEVPHYLLVHPDAITEERGLSTFATVEEGTRIYSMTGDRGRLVERAGRVAAAASRDVAELAGGLLVYCAGCRMAVGDEMPKAAEMVRLAFGEAPFLGCFTFGEQGQLFGCNVHGNLMISAVAFGR